MAKRNRMSLTFDSRSENVGITRVVAAAFAAQIEFTLPEIEEIKVAISEAVSNAIIHGYSNEDGQIELIMELYETYLVYSITDWGRASTTWSRRGSPHGLLSQSAWAWGLYSWNPLWMRSRYLRLLAKAR